MFGYVLHGSIMDMVQTLWPLLKGVHFIYFSLFVFIGAPKY